MNPSLKNSLLLLFLFCCTNTWAQSSFMQVYGSVSDDRPYGIFETNEQNLVFFGSSGWKNYACMVNRYGQIFWQHIYNNKSDGDELNDGFQLNDTTLVFGGDAGFQAQSSNPRLTFIHTNGTIIKDTFYTLTALTAGIIEKMVNVPEKKYIFSIGYGMIRNPNMVSTLYVQKTDYTGKRLFSKQLPLVSPGYLFKHPQQEKYFVFGLHTKITLDSNANQIGTIDSIVPTGHELLDIVQLEDGSYYTFVDDNFFGYYVQKLDIEGIFVENWLTLPNNRDTLIYGSSLHRICVNNKKEVALAGYTFLVIIDSLKQVKASKPLLPYYSGLLTTIKPSKDGGFFGTGQYFANFDSSSYDIYVFKTKPNGDIVTSLIEPQKLSINLNVYPNPSSGIFTISGVTQHATAQITDVLGKVVVPQFNVENNTINCTTLAKGNYIITIFANNKYHRQIISIE
jgi:hypothetical protein